MPLPAPNLTRYTPPESPPRKAPMPVQKVCAVLACNAPFLEQAVRAMASIRRFADRIGDVEVTLALVAIDLDPSALETLEADGVRVFTDLDRLPTYDNQPRHGYSATCRPYLPDLFPGFDAYLWVDADIRFVRAEGLLFWLSGALNPDAALVMCQEIEPAYTVVHSAHKARLWHEAKIARMSRVWSGDLMELARYFAPFNGGLYGARADSPIWPTYRRHFEAALRRGYDHWADQDALNVSLLEVGRYIRAPGTMNWIVSLAQPLALDDGSFRDPASPERIINVLHLTESTRVVDVGDGRRMTRYDAYKILGYTD